MTEHTPGPWVFRSDDMKIIHKSGPSLTDNLHIATISRQGLETDANARLIAAAPETAAERDSLRLLNTNLLAAQDTNNAERDRLKAVNAELVEALTFVSDACTRLNDARAVATHDKEMLIEEFTDIENNARAVLAKAKRETP